MSFVAGVGGGIGRFGAGRRRAWVTRSPPRIQFEKETLGGARVSAARGILRTARGKQIGCIYEVGDG